MTYSRREALAGLAAIAAAAAQPGASWAAGDDPLRGSIAEYVAGLRQGRWTDAEVTGRALERCRADGMAWHAIDALSATAVAEARDTDARRPGGHSTRSSRTATPI